VQGALVVAMKTGALQMRGPSVLRHYEGRSGQLPDGWFPTGESARVTG
jgi:hypothetical protein